MITGRLLGVNRLFTIRDKVCLRTEDGGGRVPEDGKDEFLPHSVVVAGPTPSVTPNFVRPRPSKVIHLENDGYTYNLDGYPRRIPSSRGSKNSVKLFSTKVIL
jgi:hypothetical protein